MREKYLIKFISDYSEYPPLTHFLYFINANFSLPFSGTFLFELQCLSPMALFSNYLWVAWRGVPTLRFLQISTLT